MLIIISSTYGTKLDDSYVQNYRNETQNASFASIPMVGRFVVFRRIHFYVQLIKINASQFND